MKLERLLDESAPERSPTEGANLLTTGEMARRSANTLRTVRFYEEEGLLKPVCRTAAGHRLFTHAEFERLTLVSDLRAVGLSLDEIREVLALKASCSPADASTSGAQALLTRRLDEIRAKLAVLTRLEQDFTASAMALGRCADSTEGTTPEACASCEDLAAEPLPRTLRILRRRPSTPGSMGNPAGGAQTPPPPPASP